MEKKWFDSQWYANILIQKLLVLSDVHYLNVRWNALCSIYAMYIALVMKSWNFTLAITLYKKKTDWESNSSFYNEGRLDLV